MWKKYNSLEAFYKDYPKTYLSVDGKFSPTSFLSKISLAAWAYFEFDGGASLKDVPKQCMRGFFISPDMEFCSIDIESEFNLAFDFKSSDGVTEDFLTIAFSSYDERRAWNPSGRVAVFNPQCLETMSVPDHVAAKEDLRNQVALMKCGGLFASAKKRYKGKTAPMKRSKLMGPDRGIDSSLSFRGVYAPAKYTTWLEFHDQTTTRNNAGVIGASWRYAINSLFTVDQVSAQPIVGRTNLAAMWQYYRVVGFCMDISYTNSEAFNIICGIFPQNNTTDPGLNTTVNWQVGPEQPGALSKTIGAIGGNNMVKFHLPYRSIAQAYGPSAKMDPNFAALANGGTPASLLWTVPFFKSASGVVLVSGVVIDVRISYRVRFYSRITTST